MTSRRDPNRRGQPLLHRWYVARFTGAHLDHVEDFTTFLAATGLGRAPLPNAGDGEDLDALQALLPWAVDAVGATVRGERPGFVRRLEDELAAELGRLTRLEGVQLEFVFDAYRDRDDARSRSARERREREIGRLFRDHQDWIRDARTCGETPFLQVIAVLVGGPR